MILKPIFLTLNDVLEPDDIWLPLSERNRAKLIKLVPDGEQTILTIDDSLHHEYVLVENVCGTLTLKRGYGDTKARRFPRGSCVKFEVSVPVVKWLICNHDCCEGKCQCEPVEVQRVIFGIGRVNQPWVGRVVMSGSLPINVTFNQMPEWLEAEILGDRIEFTGTPSAAGTYVFSMGATNCQGTAVIVQSLQITIDN